MVCLPSIPADFISLEIPLFSFVDFAKRLPERPRSSFVENEVSSLRDNSRCRVDAAHWFERRKLAASRSVPEKTF